MTNTQACLGAWKERERKILADLAFNLRNGKEIETPKLNAAEMAGIEVARHKLSSPSLVEAGIAAEKALRSRASRESNAHRAALLYSAADILAEDHK